MPIETDTTCLYGGGLTNLEYAHLAEIMGQSIFASEVKRGREREREGGREGEGGRGREEEGEREGEGGREREVNEFLMLEVFFFCTGFQLQPTRYWKYGSAYTLWNRRTKSNSLLSFPSFY